MEKFRNLISVVELKRLLVTIVDSYGAVCIRYRMLGEMWQPHFMRVIRVTENGAVFEDENDKRMVIVVDLSQMMQFEIDGRIHHYIPNNHYEVTLKEFVST